MRMRVIAHFGEHVFQAGFVLVHFVGSAQGARDAETESPALSPRSFAHHQPDDLADQCQTAVSSGFSTPRSMGRRVSLWNRLAKRSIRRHTP